MSVFSLVMTDAGIVVADDSCRELGLTLPQLVKRYNQLLREYNSSRVYFYTPDLLPYMEDLERKLGLYRQALSDWGRNK